MLSGVEKELLGTIARDGESRWQWPCARAGLPLRDAQETSEQVQDLDGNAS